MENDESEGPKPTLQEHLKQAEPEEIEDFLMEMNRWIVGDVRENCHIDEMVLSGKVGFHIFAENGDGVMSGIQKKMHIAFDRAIQEASPTHLSDRDVEGELTAEHVVQQMAENIDHIIGDLRDQFLIEFGNELGLDRREAEDLIRNQPRVL